MLELLLSADFPAVDALRAQAATAKRGARACVCGCPSFYVEVDPSLPRAATIDRVPASALCDMWHGSPVEVLLHVLHGQLTEIEAVPFEDIDGEWDWPPIESLRLVVRGDQPNVNE